jgi:hypothetical protein
MKKIIYLIVLCVANTSFAQNLKPGFDKKEYIELIQAFSRWQDSTGYGDIPESKKYKTIYRAKENGLLNCWEMYDGGDHSVISIRGSVDKPLSWMANFNSAMIPAQGQLKLSDSLIYDYHFADNIRAGVHVGWASSCGYLINDITSKIKEQYANGKRDFIIFGHSQGAAIAFLVTAQLKYYQQTELLPKDIQFKTYCSAGPKPGNLYFAYDYEASIQNGWSYTIVNAADWVPELPVSIQSLNDFNNTNPFKNIKEIINKRPFYEMPILEFVYSELTRYNNKAVNKHQLYLGTFVSKSIRHEIKGYENPKYMNSNYYVRCGNSIVLNPDEEYYTKFPDSDKTILIHHSLKAYLYLLKNLNL